jgi:hypothetical protein
MLVNIADMKVIDQNTVRMPAYFLIPTFLIPEVTLKVTNRKDCSIEMEGSQYQTKKNIELYLNNVILGETYDERTILNFSKFHLVGEEYVGCVYEGTLKQCLRDWDTNAKTVDLPRIYNALKYLYSTFCTSARRKGAF